MREDDKVLARREKDVHPLLRVSFEDAIASSGSLITPLRESADDALRRVVGVASRTRKLAKLFSLRSQDDRVTLVFSPETRRKLRDGTWRLSVDEATGLERAEVRDGLGRIRESAKIRRPPGAHVERAVAGVIAVAHVISAMDVQRQVAEMDAKLDWLLDFLQAEREGELRGIYLTVQKALAERGTADGRQVLVACSQKLDELQGRFYESARAGLRAIENPANIGRIEAMFKNPSKVERDLREQLGAAMSDLRRSEFCAQVNSFIHLELEQPDAIAAQHRANAAAHRAIRDAIVEKVGYVDASLAAVLLERGTAVERLGDDELLEQRGNLVLELEGGSDG